jgi:hypothetical protein
MATRWLRSKRGVQEMLLCRVTLCPNHRLLRMEASWRTGESANDFANLDRYIGSGWVSGTTSQLDPLLQ